MQNDATKEQIDDLVFTIEDAVERIQEALGEMRHMARQVLDERAYYRLDRGALSHIEMALSNDHPYLGGNMHTVADTLNELSASSLGSCECGGDYEVVGPDGEIACIECGDDGARMAS